MRSKIIWAQVLLLALLVVFPPWALGRYRPVEGPMFPRPADQPKAPHRPQLWQEVAQIGHGPVWWSLTFEQKGEEPCRLIEERNRILLPIGPGDVFAADTHYHLAIDWRRWMAEVSLVLWIGVALLKLFG